MPQHILDKARKDALGAPRGTSPTDFSVSHRLASASWLPELECTCDGSQRLVVTRCPSVGDPHTVNVLSFQSKVLKRRTVQDEGLPCAGGQGRKGAVPHQARLSSQPFSPRCPGISLHKGRHGVHPLSCPCHAGPGPGAAQDPAPAAGALQAAAGRAQLSRAP